MPIPGHRESMFSRVMARKAGDKSQGLNLVYSCHTLDVYLLFVPNNSTIAARHTRVSVPLNRPRLRQLEAQILGGMLEGEGFHR
jgi:hypothetical protein